MAGRGALPFRLVMSIVAGFLAQAGTALAMEVSGPAVIVDGDTLWVGSQEVRIHGIDAPETSQRCQLPKGTWDCSAAVIAALASMTEGKAVRCIGNEVDQYGRLIARCSTNAVPDIGAQLVASGLAWAFIKYSTDYSSLEKALRFSGTRDLTHDHPAYKAAWKESPDREAFDIDYRRLMDETDDELIEHLDPRDDSLITFADLENCADSRAWRTTKEPKFLANRLKWLTLAGFPLPLSQHLSPQYAGPEVHGNSPNGERLGDVAPQNFFPWLCRFRHPLFVV